MVFKRFVEIGRVALVRAGPNEGKLVVIVDVIDQNRVLVDAPGNFERQVLGTKAISLTSIKFDFPRGAREAVLKKAWTEAKVDEQWGKTSWGRKLAIRAKRASQTDFDRFVTMVNRRKRSTVTRKEFAKLKKAAPAAAAKKAAPAKKAATSAPAKAAAPAKGAAAAPAKAAAAAPAKGKK